MADQTQQSAATALREALARRGIVLEEAALNGSAAYLASVTRGVERFRELGVPELTAPAHCDPEQP